MAKLTISTRRMAIDKTQARTVIIVAVASFITIFCLIASRAVYSQNQYQARVTAAKQAAHAQLQQNITNFAKLSASYNSFNNASTNVIGGSSSGSGNNVGSNSTIILDALPPTYDFPALATSISKILTAGGFQIGGINGTDEQLSEQSNNTSTSPQPVAMPFSFSINNASYSSIAQLISTLQQSIRPIQVDQINLSGSSNNMTLSVNAHTYYQPALSLSTVSKVVK